MLMHRLKKLKLNLVSNYPSNDKDANLPVLEKMSKMWTSPVYAFFEPTPTINYVNGRCAHVFKCTGHGCKFMARHFLDTGDRSSTGNMGRHIKNCWGEDAWGEDAWKAVCACRDAEDARKSVTKPLALNGSIMAIFERKTKGKVNYSHVQHTREQTKQVLTSATPIGFLFFILSGLRLFAGL
jgi:hypothetical protein